MTIDTEMLIAYADNELSPEQRATVDTALAQDPALRDKLAAHQALRARLATAFDGVLAEPVPPVLAATAHGRVVTLRRRAIWSTREWSALAASLIVGVLVGVGLVGNRGALMSPTGDGLAARGQLARALDTQLAADSAHAVRIGLTFQAQNGQYCRTFDLVQANVSGLACRDEDKWKIIMTASNVAGEVRMAGSSSDIIAKAEAMMSGEAFNAAREGNARDAQWR